jgi:neuroblastoma-amplified sequence
MHRGDMKLAYDWQVFQASSYTFSFVLRSLSVASSSVNIQRERDFIEATSKICSFNVFTRPGIPITPLEIRLTKDRLDLVARVLSSTDDAYKHSDVILDLSRKLGFKDDLAAEVKIMSMLVEVALQHEDFLKAEMTCERMMESARHIRASYPTDGAVAMPTTSQEALEVAWRSCYQLGRQSEFQDTGRKLHLLGSALELCPTANTLDVLSAWGRIEAEDIKERRRRSAARAALRPTGKRKESGVDMQDRQSRAIAAAGTLFDGLKGLSQGQEAATHMLNRFSAKFPFSIARTDEHQPAAGERDFGSLFSRGEPSPRHKVTEDVAAGARHALARGVGWLIGGDEEDS